MTIMDLTNEEILVAIDSARELAKEGKVDFNLALSTALDSIVQKKNEMLGQTEPVIEEQPIIEEQPVVEEPVYVEPTTIYDPFGDVVPRIDKVERDVVVRDCWAKIDELEDYARSWYSSASPSFDVGEMTRFVSKAKQGGIGPKYIDEHLDRFQRTPRNSEGFGDTIARISELEREAYYAYYSMSDEAEMELQRQEALAMYERLKHKGVAAFQTLESGNKWNSEAATIVVADEISRLDSLDNTFSYQEVGIVPFEGDMLLRPGEVSFSPACYDNTYYVLSGRITSDGNFHNRRMFDEARKICSETYDKIKNMTPEEFREYKIAQMKLSEEEKKKFNDDLSNAHVEEMGRSR